MSLFCKQEDNNETPHYIEDCTPTLPDLIKTDIDGRRRRGKLVLKDNGWVFEQRTKSGRTTFTYVLADLPVTWKEPLNEGTITLGWQDPTRRAKRIEKG